MSESALDDLLHYEHMNGSYELEGYEFAKLLVPFLKDESTDTVKKLVTMMTAYSDYFILKARDPKDIYRNRFQFVLNLLFEEENYLLECLQDTEKVIEVLEFMFNSN
ncbi:hypothetical protein ACQKWADRAFT_314245 [Trichoderma austrokoningii]